MLVGSNDDMAMGGMQAAAAAAAVAQCSALAASLRREETLGLSDIGS
jgi:hypothetical protein